MLASKASVKSGVDRSGGVRGAHWHMFPMAAVRGPCVDSVGTITRGGAWQ